MDIKKLQQAHSEKHGPLKVLQKVSDNPHILDLSKMMGISSTFNIMGLYDYYPEVIENLRINL